MKAFREMAALASRQLLGASSGRRISNGELARLMEEIALNDPELAEHYARMAAARPVLQAQRAAEDAEIRSAGNGSSASRPNL